MKTQAVVLLAAFLLLATFVAESDSIVGNIGKRELRGKVEKMLLCYILAICHFGTQLV